MCWLTIKGFIFRSDLKQLVYLWWRAVFVGSKVYLFVGWKFVEYSTEKGGFLLYKHFIVLGLFHLITNNTAIFVRQERIK